MYTYSCAGCNRVRFRRDYMLRDFWLSSQPKCSCGSRTVRLRQESEIRIRRGSFKRAPKFTRREQREARQLKESAGRILWNIWEDLSFTPKIPPSLFQGSSLLSGVYYA